MSRWRYRDDRYFAEVDECALAKDKRQREDDERMASIGGMIQQIAGLAGTKDVDQRTSDFIVSVVEKSENGKRTSHLSDKQVEWVEEIYKKHIGGN